MKYAIGVPGQSPRIIFEANHISKATAECKDAEVAVPVDSIGDFEITECGTMVRDRVKPIEELQDAKWREAKRYRTALLDSSCDVEGIGEFDAHGASLSRLAAAAIGECETDWKLATGETIQLTVAQARSALGVIATRNNLVMADFEEIKSRIYAATTESELEIITVDG